MARPHVTIFCVCHYDFLAQARSVRAVLLTNEHCIDKFKLEVRYGLHAISHFVPAPRTSQFELRCFVGLSTDQTDNALN